MRRMDKVYNQLCAFKDREGVDARTLSEALGLARANVSFDLNRLFEEGRAMKLSGRPVRYLAAVNVGSIQVSMESELDRLGKASPSLSSVVDQAKAAILYPPRGMHSIILGETGVGKSMFANLMYRYAVESGVRGKAAPFIVFNCADYANNPQLLTAQLFGVRKGAFTGADADREGLLEKADNGILFLDEVHRLPPEGQEALFVFLDKGDFRRVGDIECRTSNALIITATTENPSSSLLKTFTRRIPMTLRIPSLKERAIDERLDLIKGFFNLEASRISQDIYISMNLMKALLIYDAPGNVGQLKNDIQIITAKAYAEFLTGKREKVELWSPDLPPYIKESLFNERVYREVFSRLFEDDINGFTFGKGNRVHYLSTKENTIYDFIERKIGELKLRGVAEQEIDGLMEGYISEFVKLYIHKNNEGLTKSNLANIVGMETLELSERVYSHAMGRLSLPHNSNTFVALCLHLFTLLQRVKQGVSVTNPQLGIIRRKYAAEYAVAMECLELIRMSTALDIYNDEAGFLALFWLQGDPELSTKDRVKVIIIAHGESTATSMAGVTNKLLGENYAVPIDAPIEVKPQVILDRLRRYIAQNPTTEGYLLMVDMGSPTNFGKEIEKEYQTKVRMVPLVSTLHVLDATRKAISGTGLEEIYRDTLAINAASILPDYETPEEEGMKFVIVTACLTGEGSSQVMKSFLKSNLRYNRNHLDIVAISALDKEALEAKVRKIDEDSHVICLVSSLPVQMDIRSYSLVDVLSLKAIKEIQDEIDLKSTIVSMDKVIQDVLVSVRGEGLNAKIYEVIRAMEEALRTTLPVDMLPGVIMHIACMLDRLVSRAEVAAFDGKSEYIAHRPEVHRVVRRSLEQFTGPYGVDVADDEVCFVMKFFDREESA